MDNSCRCGENSWEPYKDAVILPEHLLSGGEFTAKSTGMLVNAYTCENCHNVRLIHITK